MIEWVQEGAVMAVNNISNLIECEHENACKDFNPWCGDGHKTKCLSCKKNRHKRESDNCKKSYYEECTSTKRARYVLNTVMIIMLATLIYIASK